MTEFRFFRILVLLLAAAGVLAAQTAPLTDTPQGFSTYCDPVTFNWTGVISPPTVLFYDYFGFTNTPVFLGGPSTSVTVSNLAAGQHSIAAGSIIGNFFTAWASVSHYVSPLGVAPTLQTSPNPSIVGQNVTMTVTLASCNATGTVTIYDANFVPLATDIPVVNNTATFQISTLAIGTHPLTVYYSGDGNNYMPEGRPNPLEQVVLPPSTTTMSLSANPNPSPFGQTVNLIAQVSPPEATGNVRFQEGATVLGISALNRGVATLPVTNFSVGTHNISASYGGTFAFTPVSATASVVVGKTPTTLSLSASSATANPGQQITFSVRVSNYQATGTVTFKEAGVSLGTATLSNGTGSFATGFQTSGNHTVTASYAGDTNFTGSDSNAVTVAVGLPTSTTTLSAAPTTAEFGQSVVLTATVSPSAATGSVTISDGVNSQSPTLSNGQAQATFSGLSQGTHTFTATYAGDNTYAGSVSGPVTVTISKGTSQITLTPSPNPSTVCQTVTVVANVKGSFGTAAPTGTVTFTLDGAAGQPTALSGGTAQFSSSSLTEGTHTISAGYSGDSNFQGSTSASVTLTVNKPAPPPLTRMLAGLTSRWMTPASCAD